MISSYLEQFPKPISEDDPIPEALWPSMPGVLTAKVIELPPTAVAWKKFWKAAQKFKLVSVDFETSGLRPFHGDRLCGVAAAYYDGKDIYAGYWNFRHQPHPPYCREHSTREVNPAAKITKECKVFKEQSATYLNGNRAGKPFNCRWCCTGKVDAKVPVLDLKLLKLMVPVYQHCTIIGQNFKFDSKMGYMDGLPIPERVIDAKLTAHLYNGSLERKKYKLEALAEEMGEKKLTDVVEQWMKDHGVDIKESGHAQVDFWVERPYAIADAVVTLKRVQWERERWLKLPQHKIMEVFQIENAQTPVFARMEIAGMKVDLPFIRERVKTLRVELREAEAAVFKEAGKEFQLTGEGSDGKLWEVLAERGHEPKSYTKKSGDVAVSDLALRQYDDPLCALVIAWRKVSKALSTYFLPYLIIHADPDGYVHSDYYIDGTVSGRASSVEPNLENVPKSAEEGGGDGHTVTALMEVKRCFVPRGPDRFMLFNDLSQAEMCELAGYANEKGLIEALARGEDSHEATAHMAFAGMAGQVKGSPMFKYYRKAAKTVNFGEVYGKGMARLAAELGIPVDEASRYLEMFLLFAEADPDFAKGCCSYTADEARAALKDLAFNREEWNWDGLRKLTREVEHKINPHPMEQRWATMQDHPKYHRFLNSAERFKKIYYQKLPNIKPFSKRVQSTVKSRGYVFNVYGRPYHLEADRAYVGVNRIIQGSIADRVKVAQVRCDFLLKGTKSLMINQVHDDLQFDMHVDDVGLVQKIKEAMGFFPGVRVPFKVDQEYSFTSWAERSPWEGVDKFLEDFKRRG